MRNRMLKLGKVLAGVALSFSLVATSLVAAPIPIILGTGGVSGVYYPAGGAICRLMNREHRESYACQIRSTSGSDQNIVLLQEGQVHFGLVQSDAQYKAYHGEGSYIDKPYPGLRSLFSLHAEAFTVVVREDSDISSFEKLAGKRVNIGEQGSGQVLTLEELMEFSSFTKESFGQIFNLPSAAMADALCEGKLDAMFYLVGHPSSSIKEATSGCKSKLVGFDAQFIEKLVAKYPYYRSTKIKGGEYNNNPEDVTTFGVAATFVTSVDTPDEQVYLLVKTVFENLEVLQRLHPAFIGLTPADMVSAGITAPLHPGARRYYREAGLIK